MFPAKGIYEANLDRLLTQLSKLYRTALVGKFDLAYNVYGLVQASVCNSCANIASQEIRESCSQKKGGIIW